MGQIVNVYEKRMGIEDTGRKYPFAKKVMEQEIECIKRHLDYIETFYNAPLIAHPDNKPSKDEDPMYRIRRMAKDLGFPAGTSLKDFERTLRDWLTRAEEELLRLTHDYWEETVCVAES